MGRNKGKKKNRKLLEMRCPECNAVQDSLRTDCQKCGAELHPGVTPETMMMAHVEVEAVEEAIRQVKSPPKKGSPYGPMDTAYKCLKGLDTYHHIPGMEAYITAIRGELQPYKVALLKRTYNANLIFMVVLVLFPLVPLLMGWPIMITALMGLPVLAWGAIVLKARRDYTRAYQQLPE